MKNRRLIPTLALALAAMLASPSALCALEPNDILVLFNNKSTESLRVARFYMTARQIPQDHLIPIVCDVSDNVSEEFYRTSIVPQVRKAIAQRKLDPKCIVTTYDMPLRIQARQLTAVERQEAEAVRKQIDATLADLERQVTAYDEISTEPLAVAPATAPATAPQPLTWQTLAPRLNVAATSAVRRMSALSELDRRSALQKFIGVHERTTGISGVLTILQVAANGPGAEAGQRQLAQLNTVLAGLETQAREAMKHLDAAPGRQALLDLRTKSGGLAARYRTLEEFRSYLAPDQTESSFDNELALALWDSAYPRGNWVLNPQNIETYETVQRLPAAVVPKSILVSRLDGLTPQAVEEMLLTTLKTEKAGLQGKAYFDARGFHGTDAYAAYDADIRKAAEWLKSHSSIDVVLDDAPELLKAANAPDAAIYCGWYSLRNYQDSCQWVKGAVGYHIASFEMMTLHDPKETGWVTNLLSRGFCGTLGPTDEPYLTSFPKPSLFFPLLLSGQFTQGEVWQVTAPMLSWRTAYIGDPLYSPFKANPRVKEEDLRTHPLLRNAYAILRTPIPAATAPATRGTP